MNLASRLTEERRGRLKAERLLELKQAELFAANRKLGQHARQLSEEIVETRAEVETIRDENQRVKSDLSAANQRIALTERRLWHSIQTIADGFAFFNADDEMIMANKAYLVIFDGLEIIGPGVNYMTILQVLTEEGIIDTGSLLPADWRTMMMQRRQSPAPHPMVIKLWNGKHIKMIDRRGPGGDLVSLGIDITATVEYEAQLKEARALAERANRAKSVFLANMSHEIRTPMNGVLGMADLLADTPLTGEQQLYVETIKNSSEALVVIINDVLDYSKIEAEKLDLNPEPFDLEQAMREVILLLQPAAREKGLSLLLDYDIGLPEQLNGDAGRIRQVLTNLIGNAVKFTAQGHVLVRAVGRPSAIAGHTGLHVSIEDTGIGISPAMVSEVFDEFSQVQNSCNRQFDGTGLGLAICRRLIDLMNGEIWVDSQEGEGSCFGFSLDLPVAAEALHAPEELRLGECHVLVIDDLEVNRLIVTRQLEQFGARVTSCRDGAEALRRIDASVDIVLTDHEMPRMNGLRLARALRGAGCEAPILMLSSNPGSAQRDPDAGLLQALLQKPLPRRTLCAEIATALRLSERGPRTPAQGPRRMRVLAAEDNRTNQLVLREMVKHLDLSLTMAANGEEALDAFRAERPDLIFMDISMPCMDGCEATRRIRDFEASEGGHVPIVALTAHAMHGDDADILAAGADHYLAKPLRKSQLLGQITAAWKEGMAPLWPGGPRQPSG